MEEAQKLRMPLTIGVISSFAEPPGAAMDAWSSRERHPDIAREAARPRLRNALNRDKPAEQEETVTAKRTAVGLKQPMEGCLNGVSGAHVSKIDGSAMRTARGK
jgi:hypothetical protein